MRILQICAVALLLATPVSAIADAPHGIRTSSGIDHTVASDCSHFKGAVERDPATGQVYSCLVVSANLDGPAAGAAGLNVYSFDQAVDDPGTDWLPCGYRWMGERNPPPGDGVGYSVESIDRIVHVKASLGHSAKMYGYIQIRWVQKKDANFENTDCSYGCFHSTSLIGHW